MAEVKNNEVEGWFAWAVNKAFRGTPEETKKAAQALTGVVEGLRDPEVFGSYAGAAWRNIRGEEGEGSSFVVGLVSSLSEAVFKGVVGTSGVEFLTKHSKQIGNGEKRVLENLSREIGKGKEKDPVVPAIKEVWKQLKEYNLYVGNFLVNPGTATQPTQLEPILPLQNLGHALDRLERHREAPIPRENIDVEQVRVRTNVAIDAFCEKAAQRCTMAAVDKFMRSPHTGEELNQRIRETGAEARTAYGRLYRGVRRFFAKTTFRFLYWVFSSSIRKSAHKLLEDIRGHLSNPRNVAAFTSEKIGDLAGYFQRVEQGRRQFLNPAEGQELTTFDRFLDRTIHEYGGRWTEDELFERVQDYIVHNYVTRPDLSMGRIRIPLLTPIVERVTWFFKKRIVRSWLRRTHVLENFLNRGTDAVKFAQLGMKEIFEKKLAKILEQMQLRHFQNRDEGEVGEEGEGEVGEVGEEGEGEVGEERELHGRVVEMHDDLDTLSRALHRFIEIEERKGNPNRLHALDNRSLSLLQRFLATLPIPERRLNTVRALAGRLSLDQTIVDATTRLFQTGLSSMFYDQEGLFERQIANLFSRLGKSFQTFDNEEARTEAEENYQRESREVDGRLRRLVEQLSQLAVGVAVKEKFDKTPERRHPQIVEYVASERKKIIDFSTDLEGLVAELGSAEGITSFSAKIREISARAQEMLNEAGFREAYPNVQRTLNEWYHKLLDNNLTREIIPRLETIRREQEKIEANRRADQAADQIIGHLQNDRFDQVGELILASHGILDAFTTLQHTRQEIADQRERERIAGLQEQIDRLTPRLMILKRIQALQTQRPRGGDKTIAQLRGEIDFHGDINDEIASVENQILELREQLPGQVPPPAPDSIPTDADVDRLKETLVTTLRRAKERYAQENETSDSEIQQSTHLIKGSIANMKKIGKKYHVPDTVVVGTNQLSDLLEPLVISLVEPMVRARILTLIKSFSNPVHMKQLMLRMILCDIANLQEPY